MKNLNVSGLFERGYMIVQVGRTTFNLINIKDIKHSVLNVIVEFEISDDTTEQITVVYDTLLTEIDYHIEQIESDDEDYFEDMSDGDIEYIKTTYLSELKLICDILR